MHFNFNAGTSTRYDGFQREGTCMDMESDADVVMAWGGRIGFAMRAHRAQWDWRGGTGDDQRKGEVVECSCAVGE